MTKVIHCNDCKNFADNEKAQAAKFRGKFTREHKPEEFFEGDPNSPIWIIGLNPKTDDDLKGKSADDLLNHLLTPGKKEEPYFKRFESVLPAIFEYLGKKGGVGHTDIVKCSSNNFDFPKKNKVVKNCSEILKKQIVQHKPKIIICNGSEVSKYMLENFAPGHAPPNGIYTKYTHSYKDSTEQRTHCLTVILSGFLSQLDNYAKARLGYEIAQTIADRGINLSPAPDHSSDSANEHKSLSISSL